MSSNKRVKRNVEPKAEKKPALSHAPGGYKDNYASWQLGLLDFKSDWGFYNMNEIITFDFTGELMMQLGGDDINEELYANLDSLNKKEFKNLASFIKKIQSKGISSIAKKDLNIIVEHIKREYFETEIQPKLKEFERKTWREIESETYFGKGKKKSKHHFISVSRILKDAQRRLTELQLDDIEELFSMRLTGTFRIWGIRKFSFLQIIWFDLNHEVYPVGK